MNFVCDDGEAVMRRCQQCGDAYERWAFAKNSHRRGLAIANPEFRGTCIGCEQTKRDNVKATDPFIAKARSTIKHHAVRYRIASAKLIKDYGWDVQRVAHVLRHAYDNTCVYCRRPYDTMRNGPSDVTMDIIDPEKAPYLEINTQACCRTCNQAKSDSSPEVWARKLRFWRQWEENQRLRPSRPIQLAFALDIDA